MGHRVKNVPTANPGELTSIRLQAWSIETPDGDCPSSFSSILFLIPVKTLVSLLLSWEWTTVKVISCLFLLTPENRAQIAQSLRKIRIILTRARYQAQMGFLWTLNQSHKPILYFYFFSFLPSSLCLYFCPIPPIFCVLGKHPTTDLLTQSNSISCFSPPAFWFLYFLFKMKWG